MRSKFWLFPLFAASFMMLVAFIPRNLGNEPESNWDDQTLVADVLHHFGEPHPEHYPGPLDENLVKQGRRLVTMGSMESSSTVQSRFFLCTDCHNTEREDPDLRTSDPEARLEYVIQKGMPFLQASSFFGMSNHKSWYNGDYEKKYGDLVKPARHSLKGAIHLCATVCSQGRDVDEQEMNALLQYFWHNGLRLGDLDLSEADWTRLRKAQPNQGSNPEMVKWLRGFFREGNPATFVEAPSDRGEGYEGQGDPEKGRKLYEYSCMTCHAAGGPSNYLKLDHSSVDRHWLAKSASKYSQHSFYNIIRYGTHSIEGHRPYMPNYTAERMSNSQVEDLRAYLEQ